MASREGFGGPFEKPYACVCPAKVGVDIVHTYFRFIEGGRGRVRCQVWTSEFLGAVSVTFGDKWRCFTGLFGVWCSPRGDPQRDTGHGGIFMGSLCNLAWFWECFWQRPDPRWGLPGEVLLTRAG